MKFFDRFRPRPDGRALALFNIASTPGVNSAPMTGRDILTIFKPFLSEEIAVLRSVGALGFEDDAPLGNVDKIVLAMEHLRAARTLLREAGAKRTLERCRRTLTSADGARRHAHLEPYRTARQKGGEACS